MKDGEYRVYAAGDREIIVGHAGVTVTGKQNRRVFDREADARDFLRILLGGCPGYWVELVKGDDFQAARGMDLDDGQITLADGNVIGDANSIRKHYL